MDYQHKEFPKMVYFDDGRTKIVRDQDELSQAQGEGAQDGPPNPETDDSGAQAAVKQKPEQTVRQLAGLEPADDGEKIKQQRQERAEQAKRDAAGQPSPQDEASAGRELAVKGPQRGKDFSNDASEGDRNRTREPNEARPKK